MLYNYPLAYLHKLTKAVLGVGLFFLSIAAQAQAPTIAFFSPLKAKPGDLVNITEGIWFGNDTATKDEYDKCLVHLNKMETEIAQKAKEKVSDV